MAGAGLEPTRGHFVLIIFIEFCCCLDDHCQDSSVKKMGFLEVAHGLKDGISHVGVTKMRRSEQFRYCKVW